MYWELYLSQEATKCHDIIQIHDNVMRQWQYHVEYSIIHIECEEHFAKYGQSHITMLWIWIMLWSFAVLRKLDYMHVISRYFIYVALNILKGEGPWFQLIDSCWNTRATSHMSQEPWPWNCKSPKESVQRLSQDTFKIMKCGPGYSSVVWSHMWPALNRMLFQWIYACMSSHMIKVD